MNLKVSLALVANFGMFIELPNTIEGMVHIANMTDDYYHFDERQMALIGERQAKVFRIGDTVKVKVTHVDVEERMIDFKLLACHYLKRHHHNDLLVRKPFKLKHVASR